MKLSLSCNAASPAVVFLAGALQLSPSAQAQETNGRMERCILLQQKLDAAIAMRPATRNAEAIQRLRKKAIHFCTHNKEAQGARTFARALVLYGLQPFGHDDGSTRELFDEGSLQ
jgi:hypothetical protein